MALTICAKCKREWQANSGVEPCPWCRAERAESSLAAMRQRAERAELVSVTICNIVDRLRRKFEIQRNVNFTGDYVVQQFIYAKEDLVKAIYEGNLPPADASNLTEDHISQPVNMVGEAVSKMETTGVHQQYRHLEPELWGGPEGEE